MAPVSDNVVAVAVLKSMEFTLDGSERDRAKAATMLHSYFTDKAVDAETVNGLARGGGLGQLFCNLVLRCSNASLAKEIDRLILDYPMQCHSSKAEYLGTQAQNAAIDSSIMKSTVGKYDERRKLAGGGATRIFNIGSIDKKLVPASTGKTRVVVIGAGPAGEMSVRALIMLGFDPQNITVIDKTGQYGGVWNQKNVSGGSINNPFEFNFQDQRLAAAPGPGGMMRAFLRSIEEPSAAMPSKLPKPVKGNVVEVRPGDLAHTVAYMCQDGRKEISAPIVINAIGLGRPLPMDAPDRMATYDGKCEAIRWQQVLDGRSAEVYRGKTVVMVGLGNSTAEMLMQISELNKKGYNIDYRVLTHYPKEAVNNPERTVVKDGKQYRVYRNIGESGLTKYEGDLPEARKAYEEALASGKIIPNVSGWHSENGYVTFTTNSGGTGTAKCSRLFVLIGYGHDPAEMRRMGAKVTDEYKGSIATDFDGEVQRDHNGAPGSPRDRVYAGYFAIGAVAKSDQNPNSIVVPGIMHRLYDMSFMAVLRAQEHAYMKRLAASLRGT